MVLFCIIIFETSPEINISFLMKKYAEVNKYAAVLSCGVRGWWELEEPWGRHKCRCARRASPPRQRAVSTSQVKRVCYR